MNRRLSEENAIYLVDFLHCRSLLLHSMEKVTVEINVKKKPNCRHGTKKPNTRVYAWLLLASSASKFVAEEEQFINDPQRRSQKMYF